MANCAYCGNKTSWLTGRTKRYDLEFCGSTCANEWHAARLREAYAKAETAQRLAEAKSERAGALARAKSAKIKEVAAAAKWKQVSADLRRKVRSERNNPLLHIELARLAGDHNRLNVSKEHYLTAFAIGFTDAFEEATAHWELADIIWKVAAKKSWQDYSTRWWSGYPNLGIFADEFATWSSKDRRPVESKIGDVLHHVSLARKALESHLRWNVDDVDALKLLGRVVVLLGEESAGIKQRIEVAKRRRRLMGVKSAGKGDKTGLAFEARCLSLIRSLGWSADVTRASGDGGIDILAHSDDPFTGGRLVIQCKDWAAAVGEPPVRDLLGVVVSEDAVKGVLITSGTFTDAARRFAAGKRLELIDGTELSRLERRVGTDRDTEAHDASQSPPNDVRPRVRVRKTKTDGGADPTS